MDNRKKKPLIWIINQFAGTLESGWGERHYYFSKYWINEGYDVRIISASFNHLFKINKDIKTLYEEEIYNDVKFIWVKTPKYNPRSWQRFFSMLIFSLRIMQLPILKIGRPDLVIVSSMPIFPILSAYLLRLKWKFKLIFEIRDIWPLTLQLLGNKPAWHPAIILISWFEKLGYRNSDALVSLLPNAKNHMESIARKEINFNYIPNGIDLANTSNEDLPLEIISKIPSNKFIIGYAGTIGIANALEHFVDAAQLLRHKEEIFFIVVGDGYLKDELTKITEGLSNILFFQKVPKNQVQHLLSFFDVCFVGRNDSSLYKHGVSANKYFDYMLAGKPILNSNNYIKDPVELSGCGVIVKPDSVEAIREGIILLYELSESERAKMGSLGNEYVRKYHDISYLSNLYVELFKRLLE